MWIDTCPSGFLLLFCFFSRRKKANFLSELEYFIAFEAVWRKQNSLMEFAKFTITRKQINSNRFTSKRNETNMMISNKTSPSERYGVCVRARGKSVYAVRAKRRVNWLLFLVCYCSLVLWAGVFSVSTTSLVRKGKSR